MPDEIQLSEREREILKLIATGATNPQIAGNLGISVNTVKVHLRNIFSKIGSASRTEATLYAIRTGIIEVATGVPQRIEPETLSIPVEPINISIESDIDDQLLADPPAPPADPTPIRRFPRATIGALVVAGVGLALIAIYLLLVRTPVPETPTDTSQAATNRWKSHPSMPQPRTDFAVITYDRQIYTIGGAGTNGALATVERFDPASNTWTTLNPKPTPVTHVQAAVIGSNLYIPGGEGAGGKTLDIFESYNPRTKEWEQLPPLPAPRSRYAIASFEGRLYLFGGWDGAQVRDEVLIYDPRSRTWSEGLRMPTARRSAGVVEVDRWMYVIGGENGSSGLSAVERYDPTIGAIGQWERMNPLPSVIATPAVAGIPGLIVLVFDPQSHTALQYNITANTWLPLEVPEQVSLSTRAVFLSGSIYLFSDSSSATPGALNEYRGIFSMFLPGVNSGGP